MLYVNKERGATYQGSGQNENLMVFLVTLVCLGHAGCEFIGRAAAGAGAAGAGYKYNAYRQMQHLEADYKAERISRKQYEERKNG